MLFSDAYFTVEKQSEGLFKDRGSKFIAYLFPVKDETEIKTALTQLRKEHPSARHHCYAWVLGVDRSAVRSNDDGEPSNTAGKPILMQIHSKQLTNVLVVVVRYFGGTLLGVNGLINAYKNAAADAIAQAEILEKHIQSEYSISFDSDDLSQVMRLLKELQAEIISHEYHDTNMIRFSIRLSLCDKLEQHCLQLYKTKLTFIATK